MILGAAVGGVAAVGIGGGFHLALPWLINVALAKLTLVASGGIMTGGAVVRRIGLRREQAPTSIRRSNGERMLPR
jgi:hypothetical protein